MNNRGQPFFVKKEVINKKCKKVVINGKKCLYLQPNDF